jgi:hypothetical protein
MPFKPKENEEDYDLPDESGCDPKLAEDAKCAIANALIELAARMKECAPCQGLSSEYEKIAARIAQIAGLGAAACDIENGSAVDEKGEHLDQESANAKLSEILGSLREMTDSEIAEAERKRKEAMAKEEGQGPSDDPLDDFHVGGI